MCQAGLFCLLLYTVTALGDTLVTLTVVGLLWLKL